MRKNERDGGDERRMSANMLSRRMQLPIESGMVPVSLFSFKNLFSRGLVFSFFVLGRREKRKKHKQVVEIGERANFFRNGTFELVS